MSLDASSWSKWPPRPISWHGVSVSLTCLFLMLLGCFLTLWQSSHVIVSLPRLSGLFGMFSGSSSFFACSECSRTCFDAFYSFFYMYLASSSPSDGAGTPTLLLISSSLQLRSTFHFSSSLILRSLVSQSTGLSSGSGECSGMSPSISLSH